MRELRNQSTLIEVNTHSYDAGATVTGRMTKDELGTIEEAQVALRESIERSKALADEAELLVRQLRSDGDPDSTAPATPEL
jgi:hypothetical protein